MENEQATIEETAEKVAVYAGTRNVYPQMYTALKSLLLNTPMDRVYLLIEDDEFPYVVPDFVISMNMSKQEYFPADSANYSSPWSYMALLKCALSQILPNEHKVLWLDVDTIVDQDISDLFATDIRTSYYAAVMEWHKSKDIFRYVNVGVLLCNLDMLRAFGKELEMITFLNITKMGLPDQNIINLLCQGMIRIVESTYNANDYTTYCLYPKIVHYAARQNYTEDWLYKKYAAIEFAKGAESDE